MKAAILISPEKLVIDEVPIFPLEADEVQVKVSACGICGSDLRYFKGENPWALHTLGKNIKNPPNIILGHEFCGIVCDAGSKENEHLIGKRVVVAPYKACGYCFDCRHGNYNLCCSTKHIGHAAGWGKKDIYPGGMAEYCPVWADKCYELPENVDNNISTFLDIVGVGIHALNTAYIKPISSVLVIGCGPLGFSILTCSPYWGAIKRFATEPNKKARKIISDLGIVSFSGLEKDLDKNILDATEGQGMNSVFDTVGNRETLELGLNLVAPGGVIVNLAIHHKELRFFLDKLSRERIIRSSCNYLFEEFNKAIDLVASGKIDLSSYITHKIPLTKAPEAFLIALDREESGALKVVLKP